jgi:hypothetical protein
MDFNSVISYIKSVWGLIGNKIKKQHIIGALFFAIFQMAIVAFVFKEKIINGDVYLFEEIDKKLELILNVTQQKNQTKIYPSLINKPLTDHLDRITNNNGKNKIYFITGRKNSGKYKFIFDYHSEKGNCLFIKLFSTPRRYKNMLKYGNIIRNNNKISTIQFLSNIEHFINNKFKKEGDSYKIITMIFEGVENLNPKEMKKLISISHHLNERKKCKIIMIIPDYLFLMDKFLQSTSNSIEQYDYYYYYLNYEKYKQEIKNETMEYIKRENIVISETDIIKLLEFSKNRLEIIYSVLNNIKTMGYKLEKSLNLKYQNTKKRIYSFIYKKTHVYENETLEIDFCKLFKHFSNHSLMKHSTFLSTFHSDQILLYLIKNNILVLHYDLDKKNNYITYYLPIFQNISKQIIKNSYCSENNIKN